MSWVRIPIPLLNKKAPKRALSPMLRLVPRYTDLRSAGYGPVSLDSVLRQAELPGNRRRTEFGARVLQTLAAASQTLARDFVYSVKESWIRLLPFRLRPLPAVLGEAMDNNVDIHACPARLASTDLGKSRQKDGGPNSQFCDLSTFRACGRMEGLFRPVAFAFSTGKGSPASGHIC